MKKCVLCGVAADELGRADACEYVCEACGTYTAARYWITTVVESGALTIEQRIKLCGVVRFETDRDGGLKGEIRNDSYEAIIARHQPPTRLGQVHRFILRANKLTRDFGAPAVFAPSSRLARELYFDDRNPNDLPRFVDAVCGAGFAEEHKPNGKSFSVVLTIKGLRLADRLSAPGTGAGEKIRLLMVTGMGLQRWRRRAAATPR